jgi:hypothetical protein
MKWIRTTKMSHSNHWMLEGAERPVELRYNAEARSFRLNVGESRLYFLERTGFFHSKMLITAEYNVMVGECLFIKNRFAGILQCESSKYEFRVKEDHISLSLRNTPPFAQLIIEDIDNLDHFEFVALLFAFSNLQQLHFQNKEEILKQRQ